MRRDAVATAGSFAISLLAWEIAVRWFEAPAYVIPGPVAIVSAFAASPGELLRALGSTLLVTLAALAAATMAGVGLAAAMAVSPLARAALKPWTTVLQVTPIVAIAPLIVVWVGDPFAALVACATIVAFFPVFSGTLTGFFRATPEHVDLFRLYGASRWQTLVRLRLPSAVPTALAGLRVSGGLALVGAVVAEFVVGSGGVASGLAYRILESGYRLQVPRMFAALVLLAIAGVLIDAALGRFGRWVLRRMGEV